jgi:predicted RNA-binding protein with PIN domain
MICNYCKKPGNFKADCFKLMMKNENLGNISQRNGMASARKDFLSTISSYESFKIICIGGIGISCHYCNSNEGIFDRETISEMITVGNGSTI